MVKRKATAMRLSLKAAEAEYIYMLIKDKPSLHAQKLRKKLAGKFKSIAWKEGRRDD
tara:strand:- start:2534 stop:2704 length:171 start_codon:yes stop_codon:yes gene_type:complete